MDNDTVELIAQSDPVGLDVVRTSKEFDLPCSGTQPFNDPVDFVRFVRSGADLDEKGKKKKLQ